MKEFTNNILKKLNFKLNGGIKLFDSFAGIGALHQALKELGVPVELVGTSEIDVNAIISYSAVHEISIDEVEPLGVEEMKQYLIDRNIGYDFTKGKSTVPRMRKDKLEILYKSCVATNNLGDISLINLDDIPDFDLFNMSFPCTDLSVSGKQKGMTNDDGTPTRSGLAKFGVEIIKHKKPKYIMIENVKGLITKKFINDFYSIINEIEGYGYACYYPKKENGQPTCLNAKNYGIPQNRERIYVICVRKDIDNGFFSFPNGWDSGIRLKDILEDEVDEKYYLSKEIQDRFKPSKKEDKNQNELNIVGTTAPECRTIGQRDLTYGTNGIMSTLTSTDYKQPKQKLEKSFIDKQNRIQTFNTKENYIQWDVSGKGSNSQQDRAYYQDSFSPALSHCNASGDKSQVILGDKDEVINNSISGKYNEDDRIEQKLESRDDNRRNNDKPKLVGGIGEINFRKQYRQGNRVYDSENVAMSLMSQPIGNTGGNSYSYKVNNQANIITNFRIRKLTPKECWRLMGFRDECFDRAKNSGMSDSALYKQAGNSIVVNVLYYIFKELFKEYIVE